jgi:hypothetical protein
MSVTPRWAGAALTTRLSRYARLRGMRGDICAVA